MRILRVHSSLLSPQHRGCQGNAIGEMPSSVSWYRAKEFVGDSAILPLVDTRSGCAELETF